MVLDQVWCKWVVSIDDSQMMVVFRTRLYQYGKNYSVAVFFLSAALLPTFLVEMPKAKYNGQKFIKLVTNKTPPTAKRVIARIPEI